MKQAPTLERQIFTASFERRFLLASGFILLSWGVYLSERVPPQSIVYLICHWGAFFCIAFLAVIRSYLLFRPLQLSIDNEGIKIHKLFRSEFYRWEDITRPFQIHHKGKINSLEITFGLNEKRLNQRKKHKKRQQICFFAQEFGCPKNTVDLLNHYRDARITELARTDPTIDINDIDLKFGGGPFNPWPLFIVGLMGPVLIGLALYVFFKM
nr:hypothetical protein [uncultured Cohaesibacter sp.]